jgi:hypothetical protein
MKSQLPFDKLILVLMLFLLFFSVDVQTKRPCFEFIKKEIRMRCSRRCFLINNRASFAEREDKISKLIQMIQENENIHANSFYNQEMFDHVERFDREWNNEQFYRKQKNGRV